jgi:hypothetical protein
MGCPSFGPDERKIDAADVLFPHEGSRTKKYYPRVPP